MMEAIISIGIPGCGKTTFLKPLAEKCRMVYVNGDDIRQEVTGNPADHSKEVIVWRIAHARIAEALKTQGVVVDGTFTRRRDRIAMVKFCHQNGASKVTGYWFRTPVEVCSQRNIKRARIVPTEAMEKMSRRLELNPPQTGEGFDELVEID